MGTVQFCLMPSVTDFKFRLAQLFDEVKCDILPKNQEADSTLKLEEISRALLCESLVLVFMSIWSLNEARPSASADTIIGRYACHVDRTACARTCVPLRLRAQHTSVFPKPPR